MNKKIDFMIALEKVSLRVDNHMFALIFPYEDM